MKSLLLLSFGAFCLSLHAQNIMLATARDFKMAEGSFAGTFTYAENSSGKPFTRPAHLQLRLNKNMVILALSYPDGPKANGNDTLLISADGRSINGAAIVARAEQEDGTIKIITGQQTIFGNVDQMANVRRYYYAGKNSFQMREEVQLNGSDKWIFRNEYVFSR